MPALELLREVGAERAQPVLEEPRELLPRVLVGELDSHSPVVGHSRRIVRCCARPVGLRVDAAHRPGRGASLFAHQHRLGLALQVDVGLAADVDRDAAGSCRP